MNNIQIKAQDIQKDFHNGFSIKKVSFSLNGGTTVAFLGPNGAGKSTLFQLLTGNYELTAGKIWLEKEELTIDHVHLRKKIGYLPQDPRLPKWVSGIELLRYAASLHQLKNPQQIVQATLSYWDCDSFKNVPLEICSHGMQKRIGLALATIHDPHYLILDEPFSGLDMYHMHSLENTITARQKKGKLTIISTHIAPYVAKLCQKVFVIKAGKLDRIKDWETFDDTKRMHVIKEHFINA